MKQEVQAMSEVFITKNGATVRCSLGNYTQEQIEANRRQLEKVILQIAENAVARYGVEGAIQRIQNGRHARMMEEHA